MNWVKYGVPIRDDLLCPSFFSAVLYCVLLLQGLLHIYFYIFRYFIELMFSADISS